MVISILKIRRPLGRLIFNMGIAIPGKTVFLIETASWSCHGAKLVITDGPGGCPRMTSSNEKMFYVTGPLCGEFTGDRGIPLTKASDAEPWCFLWSAPWLNGWVNNSWGWWFETPWRSLWHHCYANTSSREVPLAIRKTGVMPAEIYSKQLMCESP